MPAAYSQMVQTEKQYVNHIWKETWLLMVVTSEKGNEMRGEVMKWDPCFFLFNLFNCEIYNMHKNTYNYKCIV